jgi:CheY-like chemotaxis protein
LILHELGTNARKYGSLSVPNGRLSVTWSVRANRGRELLLQWQESGGPAVRAPSTRGFGTTLIERSLAAHGGEAAVHYRADGVACDIRLPLAENTLSREGMSGVLSQARVSLAPSEWAGPSGLRGKRILVVEDEPLIAMDIGASLSDAGCEVVGPAPSIESAKALIAAADFDAALLDANLGGRPADELAAALTRLNIPFIFVTGYGREGLPEAFRQGPVISKPFMPEQAVAMLARLLQKNENVVQIRQKNT